MANNSGSIGCLVLVGIGAVIAGAVYGVRSCNHSSQTRPFASHMSEYTNISDLKESSSALTTFSGKAISIERRPRSRQTFLIYHHESSHKAGRGLRLSGSHTDMWRFLSLKAYVRLRGYGDRYLSGTIIGRSFTGESPPQKKVTVVTGTKTKQHH